MKKSINELKEYLLKYYRDEEGNIDISGLDFSDFEGDVKISDMSVKGNLFQDTHNVQGFLNQSNHSVNGDLFQRFQSVEGDLVQEANLVFGDLYQCGQYVHGELQQEEPYNPTKDEVVSKKEE